MKAKNEKHSTCLLKTVQEAGLILLFVGEVDHQQALAATTRTVQRVS
jgi:hypothetical protein